MAPGTVSGKSGTPCSGKSARPVSGYAKLKKEVKKRAREGKKLLREKEKELRSKERELKAVKKEQASGSQTGRHQDNVGSKMFVLIQRARVKRVRAA